MWMKRHPSYRKLGGKDKDLGGETKIVKYRERAPNLAETIRPKNPCKRARGRQSFQEDAIAEGECSLGTRLG